MTKNLEELFNMKEMSKIEEISDNIDDESDDEDFDLPILKKTADIEKILNIDIDGSDKEFDELAKEAMDSYKNLMETADNFSDTKYAGSFYQSAVSMLKNAIDAKNSKVNAKLRKMELLLKAEKLTQTNKGDSDLDQEMSGKTIIASRADILNAMKDKD